MSEKKNEFTPEERDAIQRYLRLNLGPDYISQRVGAGNNKVSYIEGWKAIELANEAFGFDGWSSSIRDITTDFMDVKDGKFSCGISCVVRIEVKGGIFHEDVGYGISENQKTKGAAFDKAKKESVTDAIKRTLRLFGNALGLCLYDKDFLLFANKLPKKKREYVADELTHYGDTPSKRQSRERSRQSSIPQTSNLQRTFSALTTPCSVKQETASTLEDVPIKPEDNIEPEEQDFGGSEFDALFEAGEQQEDGYDLEMENLESGTSEFEGKQKPNDPNLQKIEKNQKELEISSQPSQPIPSKPNNFQKNSVSKVSNNSSKPIGYGNSNSSYNQQRPQQTLVNNSNSSPKRPQQNYQHPMSPALTPNSSGNNSNS